MTSADKLQAGDVPTVDITAKRFAFSPDKITLTKGKTVKLRIHSEDVNPWILSSSSQTGRGDSRWSYHGSDRDTAGGGYLYVDLRSLLWREPRQHEYDGCGGVMIRAVRVRFLQATAVTCIATLMFLAGCEVRTPGTLETRLMQGTKRRLTIGGRSDVNPLTATSDNIERGQRTFGAYCMVCHGLDGQNTGVPFAEKMSPPVPALSSTAVQSYSDGQLHWIIQNGVSPSGMPASKDLFRDDEIWQLVLYIRHLPSKGSLGEPAVYGGEGNPPTAKPRQLAAALKLSANASVIV